MIISSDTPVRSFRDIIKWENLLSYEPAMDKEVFLRSMYVVQEIDRTKRAAEFLQKNDLVEFGKLMYATHEGLSQQYHVSCAELDYLVEQAKADPAVIGARLMGGGFGGCTINIVQEEAVLNFVTKTTQKYQEQFQITPEAYIVETCDGVMKLRP